MSYELATGTFQGPLEKLLELIEARELVITEISLAEVTNDFLRHLETLRALPVAEANRHEHLRLLADFIVVASRLVFIKSKSLLPDLTLTETEEADIKDLEQRLALYREFRPAMRHVEKLWRKGATMHGRGYLMNAKQWFRAKEAAVFYPGSTTTAASLAENLGRMFSVFESLLKEEEVIRGTIVTLEEKISQITKQLSTLAETSFTNLSQAQSRSEKIITFLAILHLAREQRIQIEQTEHLSDIIIRKYEVRNPKHDTWQ